MGIIHKEDIIGYQSKREVFCVEGATYEDLDGIKEDEILLNNDGEDNKLIFCDRCKKHIQ